MQIRVEQGKGAKDRYTLLSPRLLAELKAYMKCVSIGDLAVSGHLRPTASHG